MASLDDISDIDSDNFSITSLVSREAPEEGSLSVDATPTSASLPKPIERTYSESYFFDLVVFKVKDVFYRVPQHRFIADSTKFHTLYPLPKGDKSQDAGSSEENPIEILEVEPIEFTRFLQALYPGPLETPLAPNRTLDEWTSVLKLATMWSFGFLREAVIKCMEDIVKPLDSVAKIYLSQEYHVARWFIDGFHELVTRDGQITSRESIDLRQAWTWVVLSARERCWAAAHRNNTVTLCVDSFPVPGCAKPESHRDELHRALEVELKEIKRLAKDCSGDALVEPETSAATSGRCKRHGREKSQCTKCKRR